MKRKKGTLWILLGLALILGAVGLTAYNLWDDHRAGQEADQVLEELAPLIPADPIPPEGRKTANGSGAVTVEFPSYVLDPTMDLPILSRDGLDYVGILYLPTVDRQLPVIDTWSYPNLKTAPCRYAGTPYQENMVICGHNYDRHFGPIRSLEPGDPVIFTDVDGNSFRYEVCLTEVLDPTAVEEFTSGEWALSLFTCTVGARDRVVVRCEIG